MCEDCIIRLYAINQPQPTECVWRACVRVWCVRAFVVRACVCGARVCVCCARVCTCLTYLDANFQTFPTLPPQACCTAGSPDHDNQYICESGKWGAKDYRAYDWFKTGPAPNNHTSQPDFSANETNSAYLIRYVCCYGDH